MIRGHKNTRKEKVAYSRVAKRLADQHQNKVALVVKIKYEAL